MLYLLYLPALTAIILLYFRLAVRYNIVDKPNHRSSHNRLAIRGAGVIFPIAILIQCLISGFEYPFFAVGLIIISLISFYDDIKPLSNKTRLLGHLTAVSFLFVEANLMDYSIWLIVLLYILAIGTINAYNFMDGINGITGGYSLITVGTLYFVNERVLTFISPGILLAAIFSLIVFNLYNFRKGARCFAGDVGSVSIAFIIIFFLSLLIAKTADFRYIGFLLIYGLDAVSTIIFRLIRRENIFMAHRTHFYQHLFNVRKWPHLRISGLYMSIQLLINIVLIYINLSPLAFILTLLISGLIFVGIRFRIEGKNHLIGEWSTQSA